MCEVPFHLHYTLNRTQRLVPLVRIWGLGYTPFVITLFAFFSVQTVVSICRLSLQGVGVFGGLALLVFFLCRGLFRGLVDVLTVPSREVDVVFEEQAAGILLGRERWYLFLDGIHDIRQYRRDLWTIQHHNGSVLHIPAAAIRPEQLEHLTTAMERGRTPEGVKAVIERGRQITRLTNENKRT